MRNLPRVFPKPPETEIGPMVPFVTGSHAYGKPNDSDIDLVVFMKEDLGHSLFLFDERISQDEAVARCRGYVHGDLSPIKIGMLDIIPVTTELEYEYWRRGTLELIEMASVAPQGYVTREDAVKHLDALKAELFKGGDDA